MLTKPEQIPLKVGDIAYLRGRSDYDNLRRGSKVKVLEVSKGILSGVNNYYAYVEDVETGYKAIAYWWRFRPESFTEDEFDEFMRTS